MRKHTVGGAENPGTTTALVVPPYQPSTPQGLGHQSSMETYSHNFLYISKGVDNDFISDYRSSSSVDNDHMDVENYVDNLGLCEESDDDIKADYISADGKSNNNTEIPNVKGRLASHLPFWKSTGASDFILQLIEKGYALPFISEPKPAVFSNNRSAKDNKEFVTSEILKLLELGCLREVNRSEVHTINPLSVADNGKKLRLILDLRYINQHLRVPKTKYEDMRNFRDLLDKGDFFLQGRPEIRLSPPGHS